MLGLCTKEFHGPWRIVIGEENDGRVSHSIADSRNHFVCSMDGECPTGDEVRLGNLIKSAPDLLSALDGLLGCTDLNLDELDPSTYPLLEQAHAAIRKAKGES